MKGGLNMSGNMKLEEEWATLMQEQLEMARAVRALADLVEFLGEEVFRGRKAAIWRAMVEDVEAEHYGEFKDYLLGFDKKSKG